MKCDRCGKEFDPQEFEAESWSVEDTYEFEHLCESCARELLDIAANSPELEIEVSDPNYYSTEYHKCYLCDQIYLESELKKEGEGEGEWMCQDCINECISRGEPLLLHY